jgi:hypothetical protein
MPFPSYDCVPATNMKMRRNGNKNNPCADILVAATSSTVLSGKKIVVQAGFGGPRIKEMRTNLDKI